MSATCFKRLQQEFKKKKDETGLVKSQQLLKL